MIFRRFEYLQDFDSGQRNLKTRFAQFLVFFKHYFPPTLLSVPINQVLSRFVLPSGSLRMKIANRLILVATLFAGLAGCSYFQFPGVHKIYVQQGHIITEEMLDQIEPGLTKRQVRYVLGATLLADSFNDDERRVGKERTLGEAE